LKLIIEPVSVPKARKLTELDLQGVFLITPNTDELLVMVDDGITEETACMKSLVTAGVQQVWLRKGAEGSVFYNEQLKDFHLPAASLTVTDATGAGDAALAAWIKFYLDGHYNEKCVKAGHALAYEVLQQVGSVLKNLTDQKLISSIKKYYNDVI
jgi:pseudouridine kinase